MELLDVIASRSCKYSWVGNNVGRRHKDSRQSSPVSLCPIFSIEWIFGSEVLNDLPEQSGLVFLHPKNSVQVESGSDVVERDGVVQVIEDGADKGSAALNVVGAREGGVGTICVWHLEDTQEALGRKFEGKEVVPHAVAGVCKRCARRRCHLGGCLGIRVDKEDVISGSADHAIKTAHESGHFQEALVPAGCETCVDVLCLSVQLLEARLLRSRKLCPNICSGL